MATWSDTSVQASPPMPPFAHQIYFSLNQVLPLHLISRRMLDFLQEIYSSKWHVDRSLYSRLNPTTVVEIVIPWVTHRMFKSFEFYKTVNVFFAVIGWVASLDSGCCWLAVSALWHVCLSSLGVYGDVMRVKILFNKKENALVQMADGTQAQLGTLLLCYYFYYTTTTILLLLLELLLSYYYCPTSTSLRPLLL